MINYEHFDKNYPLDRLLLNRQSEMFRLHGRVDRYMSPEEIKAYGHHAEFYFKAVLRAINLNAQYDISMNSYYLVHGSGERISFSQTRSYELNSRLAEQVVFAKQRFFGDSKNTELYRRAYINYGNVFIYDSLDHLNDGFMSSDTLKMITIQKSCNESIISQIKEFERRTGVFFIKTDLQREIAELMLTTRPQF